MQLLTNKQTRLAATLLLLIVTLQTRAAPWDLDQSFNPGSTVNAAVRTIAVMQDGKVLDMLNVILDRPWLHA